MPIIKDIDEDTFWYNYNEIVGEYERSHKIGGITPRDFRHCKKIAYAIAKKVQNEAKKNFRKKYP